MGFIEETGAAQYYRDARILTIYEGTTAIQANDLVGRKTARDGGKTAKAIIAQIRKIEEELVINVDEAGDLAHIQHWLEAATDEFEVVVEYVASNAKANIREVFAGSVPYLMLAGIVVGGWNMARAAVIAQRKIAAGDNDPFYNAKIKTARFYAEHILARASGLRCAITNGAEGVLALTEDQF